MRHLNRLLIASVLGLCAIGAQARGRADTPGQFDYYAVALSWSPSYCATTRDNSEQCATGAGHGFVLHGLWPQYERGYPESCSTEQLSPQVRQKYAPLFPSAKLVGHEWSKHGSCSGLDPANYFELSARLKNQVVIPAAYRRPTSPVRTTYTDFVTAFKSANPKTQQFSILPFCSAGGRYLREVRVCYDKTGASRSCSEGEIKSSYRSCRQETFVLDRVR